MNLKNFFILKTVLASLILCSGCESFSKKEPTYLVRKQIEEENGAYVISNPRTALVGGYKLEIKESAANNRALVPEKTNVKIPSETELLDSLEIRKQQNKKELVGYVCPVEGCTNQDVHMHAEEKAKTISAPVPFESKPKEMPLTDMKKPAPVKTNQSANMLWQQDRDKMMQEINLLKSKVDQQLNTPVIPDDMEQDTYVVGEGDTLWEIAGTELGDNYRWIEIYSANRDVLPNPNQLYPGLTLILPKQAEMDDTE